MGNYGQVVALPLRVCGVIILWPCLGKHMAETPCYRVIAANNAAFAFFLVAKTVCYGAAKAWLFRYEKSHFKPSCAFARLFSVH